MIFDRADIMRKCLLGLLLIIAIGAFFPDTTHLGGDSTEHATTGHTHDNTGADIAATADDADTKHCHNGVSCMGAIATRNQLSPTSVRLQIAQMLIAADVTNTSHTLWRDPPVPIKSA